MIPSLDPSIICAAHTIIYMKSAPGREDIDAASNNENERMELRSRQA